MLLGELTTFASVFAACLEYFSQLLEKLILLAIVSAFISNLWFCAET